MTIYTPEGEQTLTDTKNILIREDGRVEWLCSHGIGHCIGHVKEWKKWMGVHGCDGCCVEAERTIKGLRKQLEQQQGKKERV